MKNIAHLKLMLKSIEAEIEPDLDIPELSKISRAEMIELIDWELKGVTEAQKTFGVIMENFVG